MAPSIQNRELKEARNRYYRTIRRARRECWEVSLAGPQGEQDQADLGNPGRCWQALRFTKGSGISITRAL
jgi:hypothetical protein